MNMRLVRHFLLAPLCALGLMTGGAASLSAWDFRSVTGTTLDLYLPQTAEASQDWGLSAGETVLFRLVPNTGWFLKANADLASRGSAVSSVKAGLGLSIPLTAGFYLNGSYVGTLFPATSRYVSNLSLDVNYETDSLWLALSGNVGFGQDVLTALWGLGGKFRFVPWLAIMTMTMAGWDQASGWDAGLWGYLECLPEPVRIRIGGSAGSFHDPSAYVKSGQEYSALAQIVWQVLDGAELNLNGQWWFGDRNSNKRSIGLSVSLQW